jgi:hypothetical protein
MYKKAILFFLLTGCFFNSSFGQKADTIIQIKHGSSFGECSGYCISEAVYNSLYTIQTSKSWEHQSTTHPEKTQKLKTDAAYWQRLVKSIHLEKVDKLPERIGCPDCTDGGAEWIEIATTKKKYYISFEYGSKIKGIDELLFYLRQKQDKN